jgi:replicative DNA helicase
MKQKIVLYITMEMAEERIAERIDANLMNVPIQKLKTLDKKIFDDRINTIKQKTSGKLFIKQFPTGNAHVGHFRALLNDLRQKKKFVPDVIFIDYLNICASSRIRGLGGSVNTYSYVKSIAEEVRGLAIETETVIISSTQSNRGAANSSDFGIENISESFGVAATVDLLLGLISTDELAQQNQIMVKQLKNRYNDLQYYNKFVVGVDRSRMRLFDVDDGMGSSAVSVTPTGSGDAVASSSADFSGFEV